MTPHRGRRWKGSPQRATTPRFTRKGNDLYVTVLGKPKAQTISIGDLPAKQGTAIAELGDNNELGTEVQINGMRIVLHGTLKGDYAYSFKLSGYAAD